MRRKKLLSRDEIFNMKLNAEKKLMTLTDKKNTYRVQFSAEDPMKGCYEQLTSIQIEGQCLV
jgi:hypothetical protein